MKRVPTLVTIPFSHYCEKARWSLEHCGVAFVEDPHVPLLHWLPVRRAGGRRTVPVLRAGDAVLDDSTDIAAWADAQRPGALLPAGAARAEALALEDEFDRELGPAARRWGYFQLLPRKDLLALMRGAVPSWELAALGLVRPLAIGLMRRGLKVTPAGVDRSRARIAEVFARVAARLADGRRYLAGDAFSIADLTFAALAAPILRPAEYRLGFASDLVLSPAATAEIGAWRAHPAGQHGLRMYAEHRR